ILTSIILMDAIPVVQFEGLLALDDLSADRTTSGLLLQEFCTKRRGRLQRHLSISILKVGLPVGVEWVGVALDLDMTLGFNRLLETDEVCASCWIREAPGFARLMGKVARSDPASRFVRVAQLGPAIEPAPDEAVELRKRLATEDVAAGGCPGRGDRGRCLELRGPRAARRAGRRGCVLPLALSVHWLACGCHV